MSDDLDIRQPSYRWAYWVLTLSGVGVLAYLALANWIWNG